MQKGTFPKQFLDAIKMAFPQRLRQTHYNPERTPAFKLAQQARLSPEAKRAVDARYIDVAEQRAWAEKETGVLALCADLDRWVSTTKLEILNEENARAHASPLDDAKLDDLTAQRLAGWLAEEMPGEPALNGGCSSLAEFYLYLSSIYHTAVDPQVSGTMFDAKFDNPAVQRQSSLHLPLFLRAIEKVIIERWIPVHVGYWQRQVRDDTFRDFLASLSIVAQFTGNVERGFKEHVRELASAFRRERLSAHIDGLTRHQPMKALDGLLSDLILLYPFCREAQKRTEFQQKFAEAIRDVDVLYLKGLHNALLSLRQPNDYMVFSGQECEYLALLRDLVLKHIRVKTITTVYNKWIQDAKQVTQEDRASIAECDNALIQEVLATLPLHPAGSQRAQASHAARTAGPMMSRRRKQRDDDSDDEDAESDVNVSAEVKGIGAPGAASIHVVRFVNDLKAGARRQKVIAVLNRIGRFRGHPDSGEEEAKDAKQDLPSVTAFILEQLGALEKDFLGSRTDAGVVAEMDNSRELCDRLKEEMGELLRDEDPSLQVKFIALQNFLWMHGSELVYSVRDAVISLEVPIAQGLIQANYTAAQAANQSPQCQQDLWEWLALSNLADEQMSVDRTIFRNRRIYFQAVDSALITLGSQQFDLKHVAKISLSFEDQQVLENLRGQLLGRRASYDDVRQGFNAQQAIQDVRDNIQNARREAKAGCCRELLDYVMRTFMFVVRFIVGGLILGWNVNPLYKCCTGKWLVSLWQPPIQDRVKVAHAFDNAFTKVEQSFNRRLPMDQEDEDAPPEAGSGDVLMDSAPNGAYARMT